jgi:dTDP-4-amino-4,6-dideoxygalactose transaminase/dTDP-4-dehydrorhamnose reductase
LKKKILIFGHSGNLGSNIIYFLKNHFNFLINVNKNKLYFSNVEYTTFDNFFFLKNINLIKKKITNLSPDIILNSAACTDLELCEKKPDKTLYVNVILPSILATISSELKIRFIHISTDHLYKNIKSFKNENYLTSKVNNYGYQKIQAENLIIKNNPLALIVRTNFFSHAINSGQLIYKITNAIKKNEKITLFNDYFFTPIYSKYLAKIIAFLIKKDYKGIFNVVSSERVSKYDFGKLLLKNPVEAKNFFIEAKLKNVALYPKRCSDLSLSNCKVKRIIKFKIPSLKRQVKEFLKNDDKIVSKLFVNFPYGKHSINKTDLVSVNKVLSSGFLTQGPFIKNLEDRISNYVGAKYSVAVSSATAGLHLSYQALNIDKYNRIITSPLTFVSTSNAALFCNSRPSFTDISKETLGICPNILEENLNKEKNIKAIVPVHFGGLAYDAKKIYQISKKKGLKIIEDAAHSLGAKYECGTRVGSCKYSDLTVFSFHPVKVLAGGEGGIITTNDKKLYEILISLRSHGIKKDSTIRNISVGFSKKKPNIWYYEMSRLGFHYRQTDIHSALISSQLSRINLFLNKRNELCKIYDKKFNDFDNISLVQNYFRDLSSNHLYILKINFKKLRLNRNEFMQKLRNYNIITQVHYIPVPLHLYYKNLNFNLQNLKNTKDYYDQCLSIPLYYDLEFEQQKYIIDSINELVSKNSF